MGFSCDDGGVEATRRTGPCGDRTRRGRGAHAARHRRRRHAIRPRPARCRPPRRCRPPGLTGITLYEPAELVLSARAGTPLAEVEALLAGSGQRLAFEPMDSPLRCRNEWRADHRRRGRDQRIGAAAHPGRRRARQPDRRARRHRPRRGGQIRRPRHEERHRLRPRQVPRRLLRDARRALGGDLQGPAGARDRRRPWCCPASTMRRAVAALSAALGSPYAVSGAAHIPAARRARRRDHRPRRRLCRFRRPTVANACAPNSPGSANPSMLDAASSATVWRMVRDLAALGAPTDSADLAGFGQAERRADGRRSRRPRLRLPGSLRLGRRTGVDRRRGGARRRRRNRPRRGRGGRRPCHARPRARGRPQRRRGVPAAARPAHGPDPQAQGELRPGRHPQSRPHVRGV